MFSSFYMELLFSSPRKKKVVGRCGAAAKSVKRSKNGAPSGVHTFLGRGSQPRFGAAHAVLDFVQLGSSLSLRSFLNVGHNLAVYGQFNIQQQVVRPSAQTSCAGIKGSIEFMN